MPRVWELLGGKVLGTGHVLSAPSLGVAVGLQGSGQDGQQHHESRAGVLGTELGYPSLHTAA